MRFSSRRRACSPAGSCSRNSLPIQVESRAKAIEWAARAPLGDGVEIDGRQVFEASDFPPEVFSPDEAAREQGLRDEPRERSKR